MNPWLFESCRESLVDPRETLCYDPHTQTTHPTILRQGTGKDRRGSGYLVTCYDTVVVQVTSLTNARSCSMAISFGPASRYNKRGIKSCDARTGLCLVVFEALTLASKVRRESVHCVNRVVLMLDQPWFVDALTSGKLSLETPHGMVMGHIQRVVYESARQGLDIKFWVVESSLGTDVDRMAADVLPEEDVSPIEDSHDSPLMSHHRQHAASGTLVQSPDSYTTDEISEFSLDRQE